MQTTAKELFGKKAVVTGSSSGIGRAIAIELASAGADVLVHARRSREAATKVVEEIAQRGGNSSPKAHLVMADLREAASQDELVEQAWKCLGRVDIWVNNAGADILTGSAAGESFETKLDMLWRVDVAATIRLSRMAGAKMRNQSEGGTIINVGWDAVERGMGGDSGELFAAAKGAVTAFSRSLAKTLAPKVRVNCIAPGWIKTAWGRQASAAWQDRAQGESLAQRWGTPEDVARLARFLAGPAASFVNAQTLAVNGGYQSSFDARIAPGDDWSTSS